MQVSGLRRRKQRRGRVHPGGARGAALAHGGCHLSCHPKGGGIGRGQPLQADHQVATSLLQSFADVLRRQTGRRGYIKKEIKEG